MGLRFSSVVGVRGHGDPAAGGGEGLEAGHPMA